VFVTLEENAARAPGPGIAEIVAHATPDGIFRYVSNGCIQLLGYAPNELLDHSFEGLLHPDDRPIAQRALSTLREQGATVTAKHRSRRKDGSYCWLETTGRTIRGADTGAIEEIIMLSRAGESRECAELITHHALQAPQSMEALIDRIIEGVLELDSDWRITYVNGEMERVARRSRDEILGRTLWDAFPGTVGTIFEEKYRAAMATQSPEIFEACYQPLDIWVEVRAYPAPSGLSILFQNVTERRRQVATLRESRRFLQSTLDALSAHIAILDESGTIIAVNSAWRRFGAANSLRSPEHALGVNYLAVCDAAAACGAESASEVAAGIRAVMDGSRESFHWEYPCHAPDEQRWFVVRVTRFSDPGPLHIVVAHEDISARRRAEITRAAVEVRYSSLFEQINDAVLVADVDARYLDANPAASDLLGYSREEFQQLRVPDVVADAPEWTKEEYERFKRAGTWRGELELRAKDGRYIPVDAQATVLDTTPEPRFVSVIRDIRERRALERMQQEFISMIAHDLRMPLTSIKGFAQMLERQGTYREAFVRQIISNADQLQRLISDLSDVTRIRSGILEIEPAATDLLSLARAAIESARAASERHTFHLDALPGPLVGDWDSARVTQVLQNLLSNAIKYSPDDGEIWLRLRERAGDALVEIQDQGIGIAPDDLQDLFDPFYRAASAGATATGLGLGLAISKAIVEAHGGRIWVESTPGQGSTFRFTLPLSRDDRDAPLPPSRHGHP
jgi:PAS domain S-box-containing protein